MNRVLQSTSTRNGLTPQSAFLPMRLLSIATSSAPEAMANTQTSAVYAATTTYAVASAASIAPSQKKFTAPVATLANRNVPSRFLFAPWNSFGAGSDPGNTSAPATYAAMICMLNATIHRPYAAFAMRREAGCTRWCATSAAIQNAHETQESFAHQRHAQPHPPSWVSCGSARPPGAIVTREIKVSRSYVSLACLCLCRFCADSASASSASASRDFLAARARASGSRAVLAASSALSLARLARVSSSTTRPSTFLRAREASSASHFSIQTPMPTPKKYSATYPGTEKSPSLFCDTNVSLRASAKSHSPRVSCANGLAF
mmetsp:Transcript_4156/g.16502  ORF Transcript_4156/g.16502 Transcript_4156/m.16502 type:complete len:318 (+) Transcript_4156:12-965(+)